MTKKTYTATSVVFGFMALAGILSLFGGIAFVIGGDMYYGVYLIIIAIILVVPRKAYRMYWAYKRKRKQ